MLRCIMHPPLAPLPALVGFQSVPRCHHGLHSQRQDPRYLVTEGKRSAMHSAHVSSLITGHCLDGVHGSMMQKFLILLDVAHSEEPQKKTNN